MDQFTFLSNADIASIEKLYEQYKENPESVETSWRSFFKGFEFARKDYQAETALSAEQSDALSKEFNVMDLIRGYRQRGHFFTKTNPVRQRRKYTPTLAIENFGLEQADLNTEFEAGHEIGIGKAPLYKIIEHLEETYCQSVGAEYVFIRKPEVVKWLQDYMESIRNTPRYSAEEKKHFFYHLKVSVGFENFIHRKFIGQKRFSLEGAEALIPALDSVIEKGANLGIREFVIGMPHRGRLNVLANILKKPYENIFQEFTGTEYEEDGLLGDVKYHLGYDNTVVTDTGKEVKLNLTPNPSHLEAVNPVAEGVARGKIYHNYQKDFNKVAPILIHGDAAIAGQGIVYEIVQMSLLDGYKTGGTIHLVINNQVGFTTNYIDGRSSTYSTDVAKVTRSPVFHVNGDDVEALIHTINLAMEFRQKFHSDVFIDLLCYRRYGHNEGDEPRFTQPLLYNAIANHPNPRDYYADKLIKEGIYSRGEVKQIQQDFTDYLEEKLMQSKKITKVHLDHFLKKEWEGYRPAKAADFEQSPETGITMERLQTLGKKLNELPEDKKFFKKVYKIIQDRLKMLEEDRLDWAMGELLAYASLLEEGYSVRLSGQDSERGTFAHRHASFVYLDSDQKYFPLKQIAPNQGRAYVFNSPLNEYGVMGFEYGHALTAPETLTIWEAQFGDFNNVAQPIIDQYISSAEEKWGLMNGLVLYLPHGYEGQGPEHSNARINRMLTLTAQLNMQIVVPTTPASMFHMLRRQLKRPVRKPLIVFTPKSLLRHSLVVSQLKDMAEGTRFQEVLDDPVVKPENVQRVLLCSGKVYYDLYEKRKEQEIDEVAIIRVEQLYPFPDKQLYAILERYGNKPLYWVQEEPENLGAWHFMRDHLKDRELKLISRNPSASPAPGLFQADREIQNKLVEQALRINTKVNA